MMLTITTKNFENDVLHADKPVLVVDWAQWCPYCRRICPGLPAGGRAVRRHAHHRQDQLRRGRS